MPPEVCAPLSVCDLLRVYSRQGDGLRRIARVSQSSQMASAAPMSLRRRRSHPTLITLRHRKQCQKLLAKRLVGALMRAMGHDMRWQDERTAPLYLSGEIPCYQ